MANISYSQKERKDKKLIFRPYFMGRDGKIHFPKKSRVFPMWIPFKD